MLCSLGSPYETMQDELDWISSHIDFHHTKIFALNVWYGRVYVLDEALWIEVNIENNRARARAR